MESIFIRFFECFFGRVGEKNELSLRVIIQTHISLLCHKTTRDKSGIYSISLNPFPFLPCRA